MDAEELMADTALAHLVGSGPYRLAAWRHGESLELKADTLRPEDMRAGIERVVVRFTGDPGAAVNLLLSHEADLMETLVTPQDADRVAADSAFRLDRHPSAVYGFLAFQVAGANRRPHPTLGSREVRRALAMAIDRQAVATNAFGDAVAVPAGPLSAMSWLGPAGIDQLELDTAAAGRVLRGRKVSFDILVPGTSTSRVQMAQALQEMWRRAGAEVTVTRVDFPVFQERLAAGKFDSYIGAYLDEPTLRGLEEQWGTAGWDQLNYGHWSLPRFDSLLVRAAATSDTAVAGPLYREALGLLNQDAAAIFLYNPVAATALARRLGSVTINPYAWLATLPEWKAE
jgi:ABC-type transport system substrate-binding protein